MNTRFTLFSLVTLITLLLAACASAATPVPISAEQKPAAEVERPKTVQKEAQSMPEPARPLPTQAPAAMPAPAATALPFPGTVPTPDDNYFLDYGVNPFVDTRADHLSTFALDVDTASYSVARRYVMDGNLPPAESVRVEEFVNSFKQDYPIPPDVAFAIYADGAPSPFRQDGTHILRIGIQGYNVPDAERKAATLTFVIDVSGSMEQENRLGLVKQSLQLLVDRLHPADTVAIVVYGSDARIVLNPTSGEDRATILNAIYSLRTEGATNAEAGLILGYQMAWQAFRPNAINRVILCSDGVANVGNTGPDAILESIRGYADAGVSLTSVGFGMGNFNDTLMEQLADNGDGHYAYIDSLDEARELFVEDLTATLQVIALDAKVQVDFNPDVVAFYRLVGYENRAIADESFRNDTIDAGEIGAGHTATALYSVLFQPNSTGRIATVQLRWQNPDTRQVTEINGNFNTWDLAPTFESAAPRFQLAVVVAEYAEVLRQSPWAGTTSIYRVLEYASRLPSLLPEDPEVAEFANLVSRASHIQALTQR